MRIKVGIAVYQSKALFQYCGCPSQKFNFMKGVLCNLQKTVQHIYSRAMADCLDDIDAGYFIHQSNPSSS